MVVLIRTARICCSSDRIYFYSDPSQQKETSSNLEMHTIHISRLVAAFHGNAVRACHSLHTCTTPTEHKRTTQLLDLPASPEYVLDTPVV